MTDPTMPTPNPYGKYETPAQLAADAALSMEERRRLLAEWEDDVRLRLVASEEGMTGARPRVALADILEAKALLPIDTPARPDTPSKA